MTRALLMGTTCLALTASIGAAGAAAPSTQSVADVRRVNRELSNENAELRSEVERLRREVQRLEAELARTRARTAPRAPDAFRIPNAQPLREAPGPDWIPKEFNGRTYYLIPCDDQTVAAGETRSSSATSGTVKVTTGTLLVPTTKPASTAAPQPTK